jgi:hypothetical protein
LLAYWQNINQFNEKFTYTPEPSGETLARLRGEIEKNPELLPSLINALPETSESASFIKNLYDREVSEKNMKEAGARRSNGG